MFRRADPADAAGIAALCLVVRNELVADHGPVPEYTAQQWTDWIGAHDVFVDVRPLVTGVVFAIPQLDNRAMLFATSPALNPTARTRSLRDMLLAYCDELIVGSHIWGIAALDKRMDRFFENKIGIRIVQPWGVEYHTTKEELSAAMGAVN